LPTEQVFAEVVGVDVVVLGAVEDDAVVEAVTVVGCVISGTRITPPMPLQYTVLGGRPSCSPVSLLVVLWVYVEVVRE